MLADATDAVYARPMSAVRRYETPHGTVVLRPERPEEDAPFLRALFYSHAGRDLARAQLAPAMLETLLDHQFRAADGTHRRGFPDAVFSIIERDGEPIGRLIEQDEGARVYFVDFALLPDRQAQGLGTAFIALVANEWAAKGRAARVEVLYTNRPSLRLCEKLGFKLLEDMKNGYVNLLRPLDVAKGA
jgi:GNAT superfamily N-acetyltransferase